MILSEKRHNTSQHAALSRQIRMASRSMATMTATMRGDKS
jgi:hypothetical protein